ncbi:MULTISPECIES: ATP-binding protein [Caldimonas]|uniref:sensor histidine kinase n=1 Tax=Caldimonas TaxID=196013 RepID=UPI0012F95E0B|nr:ATP-binding protein [Caldimonas taiwanensis]
MTVRLRRAARGGLPWVLILAAMLLGLARGAAPASVHRLIHAELTDHTQPAQPPRPVTLPDAWEHSAPRRDGRVSYRLAVPSAALAGDQPAVFLRRVGNVFRVTFNGELVLSVGEDRRPVSNYGQEPHLLRLPPHLVRPQDNELVIDVIGQPRREAGLSSVRVGPATALEPMYEWAMDWQVRGSWVLSSTSATLGVLALLLAWRTRQAVYAWFGLGNLIWAWRVIALHVHDPGAWAGLLHWAFELSYSLFVACMGLFLLRLGQSDGPWARRGFALFVAVAAGLSLANAALNLPLLRTIQLLLTLVVTLWTAVILARLALQRRTYPTWLMLAAVVIGAFCGARDWIVFRLWQDYEAYTWTRYAVLALILVMVWHLVEDYARSLSAQRELNRHLQAALQAKQEELERIYQERRESDRQQAVMAERDRLLRDMHDGLGGRLVSAIALARQLPAPPDADATLRDLRMALDDCLTELRLTLDSLEAEQHSLGEALAEMRFRLEPSLRAAGIRLVWDVQDQAMEAHLPAGHTLQVLRIVREAFTNVIKHAQATVVWLTLTRQGEQLRLTVLDNGLSQRAEGQSPSLLSLQGGKRGMANMQQRAALLGGHLEVGPHPNGWQVDLRFPLPGAAEAAQSSRPSLSGAA